MDNKSNMSVDRMQKFFAGEKIKTLKRYQILNEQAQKGKVLFTGSSMMEQFPINEMLMTENLSLVVYNRGIGGFTTDDMLEHMEEMIFGTEPSVIFINIGTNDIGSRDYSLEHLIENYERILKEIKERLRNVKVYLLAYYPVNDSPEVATHEWVRNALKTRTNENICFANQAVRKLAEKMECQYIDLNDGLTDEKGCLRKEFTVEGIHMYPNGYRIVMRNLMPYLKLYTEERGDLR